MGAMFIRFPRSYGDFSGYSDIAYMEFPNVIEEFDLMNNYPNSYLARYLRRNSWRRWQFIFHSLPGFRDYVYIPLGGSRGNKAKPSEISLSVFLVSGSGMAQLTLSLGVGFMRLYLFRYFLIGTEQSSLVLRGGSFINLHSEEFFVKWLPLPLYWSVWALGFF